MTQTYTRKSNCIRAARAELGPNAEPGADFILTEDAGRFSWHRIEATGAAPNLTGPDEAAGSPTNATVADGGRRQTKQALVVGLLSRPEGATLDQIVAATGWQPHSARGFIAGAAKKKLGLNVTTERVTGPDRKKATVYRIAAHEAPPLASTANAERSAATSS